MQSSTPDSSRSACELSLGIVCSGMVRTIVSSCTSPHGRSQLKHQKLGVGCYTEEVLEWSNYLRTTVLRQCQVRA